MLCHQQVVARLCPDDFVAGGDYVRLDEIVVVTYAARISPEAARRPARRVSSDAIVAACISAEGIGSADGQSRRLVAGRVYLSVDLIALSILAVIARRRYYDHA